VSPVAPAIPLSRSILRAAPHTGTDDTLNVKLTSYLSSGRLFDVYRGLILCPNDSASRPEQQAVVVKVCNPYTFSRLKPRPGDYDPGEAVEAIANEVSLLSGPLRAVQGSVVPALVGSWSGEYKLGADESTGQISKVRFEVLVLEDCGDEWAKGCVTFLFFFFFLMAKPDTVLFLSLSLWYSLELDGEELWGTLRSKIWL